MVAVNKCDRQFVNFNQKFEAIKRHVTHPIIPISAKEGTNLEVLLESLKEIVDMERQKSDELASEAGLPVDY